MKCNPNVWCEMLIVIDFICPQLLAEDITDVVLDGTTTLNGKSHL